MEKQAMTLTNVLKYLKKGFKNKIVEIKKKAPFSKLMICTFLLIPEPILSNRFNKLLDEKKIFEMRKYYSKVSENQQSEKLLTFFNSLENGK